MNNRYVAVQGKHSSLVLERLSSGLPALVHWGRKISQSPSFISWRNGTPVPSFSLDENQPLRTYPAFGRGWFGPVAFSLHGKGAEWAPMFKECEINALDESIHLTAHSDDRSLELSQNIVLNGDADCYTLSATIRNLGNDPVVVSKLMSGCLPLPSRATRIESFSGRHNHEFQPLSDRLGRAGWFRENWRGLTSHDCPPLGLVLGEGAGDHAGEVWAAQLAWSGNHQQSVEWLEDGRRLWMSGVAIAPGELVIGPGESFSTPEWLATYSPHGRNGAACNFHTELRRRSPLSKSHPVKARPVHVNTWEGFYFQHNEAELKELASVSAELGVERFVLDDGWFKGRDDDTSSLGDWVHDETKYPQGLGPLAKHVVSLGMEFGLWVEPEMINKDSDLFRLHPDWILSIDGNAEWTARNQLVLDMSKPEVQEYLFDRIDALIRSLDISYLKWDHNRDITEAGHNGHPSYISQIQSTYALLDRLLKAHRQLEIESCAGGGGRIDAGILKRTHRVWTSDCIDAVSRIEMHRGFLQFFPPETMGAHVGASPAHSTSRSQSIDFRSGVAITGHLGLEFDIRKLSAFEKEKLSSWIELYKTIRQTIHNRDVWRGDAGDGLVWTAMGSADHFYLFVVRRTPASQKFSPPVRLPFISQNRQYAVSRIDPVGDLSGNHDGVAFAKSGAMPSILTGDWLAELGLPLPYMTAETCIILEGKAVVT